MTDAPAPQPGGEAGAALMIRVLGQYVKDLSFENPNAPDSLRGQGQPEIDLSVDVRARSLDAETFEVELVLSANAKSDKGPLFIAELTYAGLFSIRNLDERAREPFLLIECPAPDLPVRAPHPGRRHARWRLPAADAGAGGFRRALPPAAGRQTARRRAAGHSLII